jgi:hypothetical protein
MAHKAGLRGNPGLLRQLGSKLAQLPTTVRAEVARQAAPVVTALAQSAFDGGQTVYGDARPRGVDGEALDLHQTGAARASLTFTAVGTQIRSTTGPRYFKYLIGKYKVLPNNALPFRWRRALDDITKAEAAKAVDAAMAGVARKVG